MSAPVCRAYRTPWTVEAVIVPTMPTSYNKSVTRNFDFTDSIGDRVMTNIPNYPTDADFLYLGFPEDKLHLLQLVTDDVREAVYEDCLRSLMEAE